jgi:hypothetical protein
MSKHVDKFNLALFGHTDMFVQLPVLYKLGHSTNGGRQADVLPVLSINQNSGVVPVHWRHTAVLLQGRG